MELLITFNNHIRCRIRWLL